MWRWCMDADHEDGRQQGIAFGVVFIGFLLFISYVYFLR